MKITKLGHCCLLIEEQGVRILTDPGSFTIETQEQVKNLDLVLITHEHQDHIHIDSVKKIITNNPGVKIITNTGVGKILENENIAFEVLEGTATTTFKQLSLSAFDCRHEEIYEDFGQVQNTGYFIGRLFYPGDAFADPGRPVDILAVPAGGPWMKISQAINYAKKLNPKSVFPVHDAMYIPSANFGGRVLQMFLEKDGIKVVPLELNQETEF